MASAAVCKQGPTLIVLSPCFDPEAGMLKQTTKTRHVIGVEINARQSSYEYTVGFDRFIIVGYQVSLCWQKRMEKKIRPFLLLLLASKGQGNKIIKHCLPDQIT